MLSPDGHDCLPHNVPGPVLMVTFGPHLSVLPDRGLTLRRGLVFVLIYFAFFSLPLLEDYSSYLLCLHISANPIESTRALSAGYELSLGDLEKGGERILIYFF